MRIYFILNFLCSKIQGVARIFGSGTLSGAKQRSGGCNPENFQDSMLILDPESTCKWHCNKKSNSHSGCKNEQQDEFEV